VLKLDALYRAQSPRLLRFFAARTADRDEARDLVQEIFCRLSRKDPGTASTLDRPEAYLTRMAINLLKDRAKAGFRHFLRFHVPADEEILPANDQQQLLETRDVLNRLEAAMLKLKPLTREIFMAHRLDGLTYAEIAERTGLSVKGVEKHMSKAIAQVDRCVSGS
jgi:RNA polymerase sigma-70 factor (ECF subfamily)